MKHFTGNYRTRSGYNYFRWSFEQQADGEVRAYILCAPPNYTHYYSEGGRSHICFDPTPKNIDDAVAIAKEWAERTENYIFYGHEF